MNITLNPFALWRKHKSQQQIIRKQCKQLTLNMQFIAELFAEISHKNKKIEQLEKQIDIANKQLKVSEIIATMNK